MTTNDWSRREGQLSVRGLRPSDPDLTTEIAALGVSPEMAEALSAGRAGRPRLFRTATLLSVVGAVLDEDGTPYPLFAAANRTRVLVVSDSRDLSIVVDAARDADSSNQAIDSLLVAATEVSIRRLEDLVDALHTDDGPLTASPSSSALRKTATTRARLLAVEDIFAAMSRLRWDGGRTWADEGRERCDWISEFAQRTYTAVGDALAQRSNAVNERLSLVNTIFLPLTLMTSFFGMNFAWLTSRVESERDFVLFGLVAPLGLAVIVLWSLRRFIR